MRRSAGCRHFSVVQRFGLTAAVCPPEAKIVFGEGGGFFSLSDGATWDLLRRGKGVFF